VRRRGKKEKSGLTWESDLDSPSHPQQRMNKEKRKGAGSKRKEMSMYRVQGKLEKPGKPDHKENKKGDGHEKLGKSLQMNLNDPPGIERKDKKLEHPNRKVGPNRT